MQIKGTNSNADADTVPHGTAVKKPLCELNLAPVMNTPGETLDFSFELCSGDLPFARPALVTGRAANHAGIVTLSGTADVHLNAQCDRCAEPFGYRANVGFSHTLVTSRASEESGELILVENFTFDAEPLIWEDIVLAMPPKLLCKPGCLGIRVQESGGRENTLNHLLPNISTSGSGTE